MFGDELHFAASKAVAKAADRCGMRLYGKSLKWHVVKTEPHRTRGLSMRIVAFIKGREVPAYVMERQDFDDMVQALTENGFEHHEQNRFYFEQRY